MKTDIRETRHHEIGSYRVYGHSTIEVARHSFVHDELSMSPNPPCRSVLPIISILFKHILQ